MKSIIAVLILVTSLSAQAYRYKFNLKGGISQTWADIKGTDNSEDLLHGTGFNTHFGYKWKYFELTFSSYIYWGEMDGLQFNAQGETIRGEGKFRHVSFGPILRYQFRGVQPFKNWFLFAGLGPVWSLQTIKMDDDFTSTGPKFNRDRKLTFESTGGILAIGIEEDLPYKEMHPVFIELVYSYKKSRKLSVVDASDFTETDILSVEEADQDLSGHFFGISVGFTVF
ncbi:MAG: hypothetical protein VXV96_08610 [Bdellovibrionota bacterium]|nr:hypothetical protein [Bdellovibrionota bacterium]